MVLQLESERRPIKDALSKGIACIVKEFRGFGHLNGVIKGGNKNVRVCHLIIVYEQFVSTFRIIAEKLRPIFADQGGLFFEKARGERIWFKV